MKSTVSRVTEVYSDNAVAAPSFKSSCLAAGVTTLAGGGQNARSSTTADPYVHVVVVKFEGGVSGTSKRGAMKIKGRPSS